MNIIFILILMTSMSFADEPEIIDYGNKGYVYKVNIKKDSSYFSIEESPTSPLISNNSFVTIPAHEISFYNSENKEVGRLDFTKNGLVFKGSADAAAKVFFLYVIKNALQSYIDAELKCVKDN